MPIKTNAPYLISSKNAKGSLINRIIKDFTNLKKNPFTSLRFPIDVEMNLKSMLVRGLKDPDWSLIEYVNDKNETVAFLMTQHCTQAVKILLAGVWPQHRGKGIFRNIIEEFTLQNSEKSVVVCHVDMKIALRQLRKLGFRKLRNAHLPEDYESWIRSRSRVRKYSGVE